MAHVEIDPPGVHQKSAIPRRLVVPAMMQVQHALTLNLKDVVADLMSEPGGRMVGAILMNEKTVFGLQPENAVQHGITIMRLGRPSARAGPVRPAPRRDILRSPAGCGPARHTQRFSPRPFYEARHTGLRHRWMPSRPVTPSHGRCRLQEPALAIGPPTPKPEERLPRPARERDP